jgi:hypothetical protein
MKTIKLIIILFSVIFIQQSSLSQPTFSEYIEELPSADFKSFGYENGVEFYLGIRYDIDEKQQIEKSLMYEALLLIINEKGQYEISQIWFDLKNTQPIFWGNAIFDSNGKFLGLGTGSKFKGSGIPEPIISMFDYIRERYNMSEK